MEDGNGSQGVGNGPIKSFQDLRVYQQSYQLMLVVLKKLIPALPKEERFDLQDQLRRCCKAVPALIAEGHAKRFHHKHWQKYLHDALGECNEMIHHISVCRDAYDKYVDLKVCGDLIDAYLAVCRQTTSLSKAWQKYHQQD